ncbi:ARM repeat-containing protein, partial [Coniochaeta hoffmannii]
MAAPSAEEQQALSFIQNFDFKLAQYSNNPRKLQEYLTSNLVPFLDKARYVMLVPKNLIPAANRIQMFTNSSSVVLPVAALVDQFRANPDYTFVRHFDIVFIRHSLDRLPPSERLPLIPRILKGIASDRGKNLDALFNIFLRLLPDLKLPPRGTSTEFRSQCGLDDPKDAEFVANWLGKLFLVVRDNKEQSLRRGLTEEEYNFLTLPAAKGIWRDEKKYSYTLTDAEKKALGFTDTCERAVRFLESDAFTDRERLLPALYASAHPKEAISSLGSDMLRRTSLSTEDPRVIKELFATYSICGHVTRTRILRLLSKSRTAATYASSIKAIFELTFNELAPFHGGEQPQPWRVDEPGDTTTMPPQEGKPTPLPLAENVKAFLDFLDWTATVGFPTDQLKDLSVHVSTGLYWVIARYLGWPRPFPWRQTTGDLDVRNHAYETIGRLAKAYPQPESRVSRILLWLTRSIHEDNNSSDAPVYLNGAVSAITSVFKPQEESVIDDLTRSLHRIMLRPGPSPRHAAAKIANDCIPYNNVLARWIDILAASGTLDDRTDVVEEGRRGLDPWTYRDVGPINLGLHHRDVRSMRPSLPNWCEMATSYFSNARGLSIFYSSGPDDVFEDRSGLRGPTPTRVDFLDLSASFELDGKWARALAVAVDYCQKIVFLGALPNFVIEPGWEGRLKVLLFSDKHTRCDIRAYLLELSDVASDSRSRGVVRHNLSYILAAALGGTRLIDKNVAVAESLVRSFVEMAPLVPGSVIGDIADRVDEVVPLLSSSRRELRLLGAKALGILGAHPLAPTTFRMQEFVADAIKKAGEATASQLTSLEGAFLGAAHVLSRQIYYGVRTRPEIDDEVLRGVPTLESVRLSSLEFVTEAFIQLWTAGIPAFGQPEDTTDRTAFITKAFIEPLGDQAKKGKEQAIKALGRLAIAYPSSDVLDLILSKLYELHEIKQAEVHLAVGEAIAAAVACWDSDAVQLTLDVQAETEAYRIPKRPEKLNEVLDKLLEDSRQTKPSLVKASGMALYCILEFCGHVGEVQARLRDCQFAFMRLLTARDDLVQETASRALALIYEIGGADLKDTLVRDFVAFFTGSGQQLKEDEEPASQSAVPSSSGTTSSSISYKDIVRLANEAGDQKLVYKFMALANSAINWRSESVFGRFGLRDLLSSPEVGVDEKLYPILFRSRFDPSPTTQKSMRAIWNAMIKDSSTVLETHFDAIMASLLKSMLGREWRVRQASCAAVKDLIDGQPFQRYRPYYKEMLAAALKLADDMKESVRQTALAFFSYLTQVLLKQLEDSGSSPSTTAMMDEIVPFLLSDRGIDSSAADVKNSAVKAIQDIAKRGGKALRPYIVTMVPCLLGFLSTYEPEIINYAYQLSGQDTREELDKSRATAVYQSSIFESITNCLRYAGKQEIDTLAPVLEDTIKSAVGMPTKVGCSGVIVHLAERHKEDFEPHCARFLGLMEKQVLDRNDTVSKNYCKAAAYLIRIAPSEDQERFVGHVLDLWFASEDEVRRRKVVDVVLGIRHAAPDHFDALESLLLPFVFLGMNEHADEYVHKQCEQLWAAVGGSPHKVARYIPELVRLVNRSLGVGNWPVKHTGALTSGKVVTSLVEGRIANAGNLAAVWPVLRESLALKTFERKQELLEALASFAEALSGLDNNTNNNSPLSNDPDDLAKDLKKIAIREAKRNNEAYRPHAFRCLQRVASALEADMLDDISDVVGPTIAEFQDSDDSSSSPLRTVTVVAAIQAIFRGYHGPNMRQDPLSELARTIWAVERHAVPRAVPSPDSLTETPLLSRPRFEGIRLAYWYPLAAGTLRAALLVRQVMPAKRPSAQGRERTGRGVGVIRWFLSTLDLERTQMGTERQRVARVEAVEAALGVWRALVVGGDD